MKEDVWFRSSVFLLVLVFIFGNILIWRRHSVSCYMPIYIQPGMQYTVGTRQYTLPNLPLKGDSLLLRPEFMQDQRELMQDLFQTCIETGVEVWVSGGTLLGYIRHRCIMPWDDDCDIHTSMDNLKIIGSTGFQVALHKYGLERVKVLGTTLAHAPSRLSGALRVRRIGTCMPTCDIFFVVREDNTVRKVDKWWNHAPTYNDKERWAEDDIFPIQTQLIDDMLIPVPNRPEVVLKQQYGETVLDEMYVRTTWIAHGYPLQVFSHFLVTEDL